jgi:hypothetical protein
MAFWALGALFLGIASLFVIGGGVVFALFVFFALCAPALLGVLAGMEGRTAHQHNRSTNTRWWRNGS